MRIWTRKSALIQPRTSLGKSDGVLPESRLRGAPPDGPAVLRALPLRDAGPEQQRELVRAQGGADGSARAS